ncbi:nebulin repeat-containing domain protein [Dictyocaulus viviparus]|uniref:Nebulin repeat-containing domain protein n=1 Tax=Dictyocaulus viviparus TaxID=29172 RepID=A0A0D8XWS3_DICVI|nr:nebulin repeat-containing domain protein [Dictyocaulus viviparus]
MSSKKCAREECGKTVWHKQCFKCTVCGMTLNMKNYKGYDKMPYCEPHYPKTVASVVTDTPEMRRVAENTKNQSQVQYHAAYEKTKGTKIDVADDPEMERHRKNMHVRQGDFGFASTSTHAQSQIAYSGELDKKKKMEEIRPAFTPAEASSELNGKGKGSTAPSNGAKPVSAQSK